MYGYLGHGFPGNGYYAVGGFPWMGLIFMLIALGVVISLVVMGFRYVNSRSGKANAPSSLDSALTILSERLARGEITKEEYEDLKQTLKKS